MVRDSAATGAASSALFSTSSTADTAADATVSVASSKSSASSTSTDAAGLKPPSGAFTEATSFWICAMAEPELLNINSLLVPSNRVSKSSFLVVTTPGNSRFDTRVADQVINVHRLLLSEAVNTSNALVQHGWIPRQF